MMGGRQESTRPRAPPLHQTDAELGCVSKKTKRTGFATEARTQSTRTTTTRPRQCCCVTHRHVDMLESWFGRTANRRNVTKSQVNKRTKPVSQPASGGGAGPRLSPKPPHGPGGAQEERRPDLLPPAAAKRSCSHSADTQSSSGRERSLFHGHSMSARLGSVSSPLSAA